MSDPRLKKLRISTGVVKRCGKEKISYRKEADMQKGRIEKMKTEGRDEIEIRKMNEVCRYFPTLYFQQTTTVHKCIDPYIIVV